MRISVIGCGYLGAVHAASMAKLGHQVVGIDVDRRKVDALNHGQAPFFEPGFQDLLRDMIESGRLGFSTDYEAAAEATVHFIAVGTPQKKGEYGADLTYLHAALRSLAPQLRPGDVVAGKSTVPVGTAVAIAASPSFAATGATLVWNPEFLREGHAVQDTVAPDRIVFGLPQDGGAEASAALHRVYERPLAEGAPLIETDYATAELVKVSANAFLATKISFINAVSRIADAAGADVTQLADAIGIDARIGRRFLNAGVGFGGGCLPKDIRAFCARAEELGVGESLDFLREVDRVNLAQRVHVVERTSELLGGDLHGRRVAILGLSFKPDSDDVRDSPALDIAVQLKGLGANPVVTDPAAIENAQARHPQLHYEADVRDALAGAELVLLLTEWKQYRALDPAEVGGLVAACSSIIDGRNALDSVAWKVAGWHYEGIGRR